MDGAELTPLPESASQNEHLLRLGRELEEATKWLQDCLEQNTMSDERARWDMRQRLIWLAGSIHRIAISF